MSWKTESRGGYPVLSVWTSTNDRWPLQGTLKMSENTYDIRWCSWNRNGRYEGDHIESEYDLIPIEPEPGKHADQHKDVGPIPKGFRLLGDEPRLASDCYWSYHDWILIGGRVEIANRDKWPAIRFVVEEPEPVLTGSMRYSFENEMFKRYGWKADQLRTHGDGRYLDLGIEQYWQAFQAGAKYQSGQVDEPEPFKQLVLVCDHEISDQALYVDGILEDFDETIYGTNIAKLAKGSLIRFDSYEVSAPEEWPRRLSDLGKLDGKQLEDPSGEWEPKKDEIEYAMDRCGVPASVFGSNPIEVRPIMQIRLPVPAIVLGKLGDMLEKHYPGSTMRQAGGYLVLDEPIES